MSRLNCKRMSSYERETDKERCKKVCLGLSVAKNPLKLDRKTGKSTEEYAVAKVLLILSMEPAMRSGEQIRQLKISYSPNGCDALTLFTVFRKNGLGIDIS